MAIGVKDSDTQQTKGHSPLSFTLSLAPSLAVGCVRRT